MKTRVVVYGPHRQAYTWVMKFRYVFNVVAYIDRTLRVGSEVEGWGGIPLYGDPGKIQYLKYDYILVADPDFEGSQREFAELYGVKREKVVCLSTGHQLGKRNLFLCLANEIHRHDIQGSVAELGVDYGDTAKYINFFFPERTCYLFDTFEGFAKQDLDYERTLHTMADGVSGAYDNRTNEKDVLARMYHPKQCVLKKGVFPDSLEGLEDTYAFVHLDCDLTKPTVAAMEYFFPRLSPGGYICIHDYYNILFPIIRQIVRQFAKVYKTAYVPVPTYEGAVFCKPFE